MTYTQRIDPTIWETRDGRQIPIGQIEDQHLLNTISMLNRHALGFRLGLLGELAAGCSVVRGDGALMAIEHEMHLLDVCPDEEVLARAVPQYVHLRDEADRRGLAAAEPA